MNHFLENNIKPVTYEQLVEQFAACGVSEGQNISVHTSLSKLGWVVGGPETVIRALIHLVGPTGTLMMPAQTWKNLDPSKGVHWEQPEEWWPLIRENWPAYDKDVTPAIGMGAVAEMFRTWPGTVRSDHPARSFCARGPQAEYLVADHDLEIIFGEGSPLDKLYELDGRILLIGVGHDKNTSLHLAETRADFTKRYVEENSAVIRNGKREWISYNTLDVDDEDFIRLGEDFEKEKGIVPCKVGMADVRLLSQRELVDYAASWFFNNRD